MQFRVESFEKRRQDRIHSHQKPTHQSELDDFGRFGDRSLLGSVVETSCRKNSRIPEVDPQHILYSSILLIQLHSLLVPSPSSSSSSSSSNPLLSLPPLALSRQLWQQFSQQLHQNNPNPNTLQALLSSLQLTRLPSSGDLGTICGILVDCCQRKRWWELLEGVLETAASILPNPEIVFNDLFARFSLVNCSVRTTLQNSEFELLCVLLRKFPLFFESTKPNLFASAIHQTKQSLQNASIEKQQIIANCFSSYPTPLPSFACTELESLIPSLPHASICEILRRLPDANLLSLLPQRTGAILSELRERSSANVWEIGRKLSEQNASIADWIDFVALLQRRRGENNDLLLEQMASDLQSNPHRELFVLAARFLAGLTSYPFSFIHSFIHS